MLMSIPQSTVSAHNTATINSPTTRIQQDLTLLSRQICENRAFEWGFGKNVSGELSLGVTKNALVPAQAIGLTEATKQIASSSNSTVLITSQGKLYFAGSTLHNKVGKGGGNKQVTKFKLQASLSEHRVRMVACNDYQTLCLLETAIVYQISA